MEAAAAAAAAAASAASASLAVDIKEEQEESDDEEAAAGGLQDEDADSVWSPDIEQSFREALAMYPPCGRRKIIIPEEGRMYGRNELIARYIRLHTGKRRSRKQVSSHIQVLARRRTKEVQTGIHDPAAKERALQRLNRLSSAQIVNAGLAHGQAATTESATATAPVLLDYQQEPHHHHQHQQQPQQQRPVAIAGPRLRLRHLAAFVEDAPWRHEFARVVGGGCGDDDSDGPGSPLERVDLSQIGDKFPEQGGLRQFLEAGPAGAAYLVKVWADVNTPLPLPERRSAYYGFSRVYESNERLTLCCSTKVCSFGQQVVEKLERQITPQLEAETGGGYVYRSERSPMCDYMVNFICRLRKLPEKYMMNTVLENFTILQVITNEETGELLLCIAYVFEVSDSTGAQHHVYRLSKA